MRKQPFDPPSAMLGQAIKEVQSSLLENIPSIPVSTTNVITITIRKEQINNGRCQSEVSPCFISTHKNGSRSRKRRW